MKYIKLLFAFLTLSFFLLACNTTKETQVQNSLPSSNGNSVVIAQIISISDTLSEPFPCTEVPCMAKVKIEKVIQSSANLFRPLAKNQEGNMRFVFTLNETSKKLFPNLDIIFPGLKAGDRFKVNVAQEQLAGSNISQWVAYEYILLH